MRWALFATLCVAAIVGVVLGLQPAGDGASARRSAPALPRQVLVPPRVDLASLHGHPALIHFWASWCVPCMHEASQLERFAKLSAGRSTSVGIDWGDGLRSARSFILRHGLTFPILRDGNGVAGRGFRLIGLPTTYVLDAEGRIAQTLYGAQTVASLDRALRAVQS